MADAEIESKMAALDVAESFAQPDEKKKSDYKKRNDLFQEYYDKYLEKVKIAKKTDDRFWVHCSDGTKKRCVKDVTTPMDVANKISRKLAKKFVVAYVDGHAWDLFRPLEFECTIQFYDFEHPEGKDVYWHSSSHILGQCLELEFGAKLTIGPSLEEGFYYDCYLGDKNLSEGDKDRIEKRFKSAIKENQEFQRLVVSRDEALAMFQENEFKLEIINGLPADAIITIYRVGPMVDLCSGPHLPNTSYLKAFAVTSMSRAFWRGDVKRKGLQRVYGITFPEPNLLKEYQHRIEEAKKRDHRNLGVQHELFFFHHLSPGSCFFLPHGARIYNSLVKFIREKYWDYEYEEVITPNVFNFDLWKISGHADHYRENMFSFDVEKQEFGLKPMNCPGHCLMFGHRVRSYRELPLRLADFGVLHRNEFSGALQGLTRVRRFQQDDAHIFCRPDQVMKEVTSFLQLLGEVYDIFGLEYTMALSTRPEGYLGELELWNRAEAALEDALKSTGRTWVLNPGDGAFYGPKIDITVYDALRRKFQCATVQLDFQLPIRFDLTYVAESGAQERPVIVHRAVLGSVERMLAILTEHYAAKWPLWLNPRQLMIVPISEASAEYAQEVRRVLRANGMYADADMTDRKMQKKVREAQLAQYNYILVVGEEERNEKTVNVRTRDNVVHGKLSLEYLVPLLVEERDERSLNSKLSGKGHQQQQQKDGALAAAGEGEEKKGEAVAADVKAEVKA